MDLNIEEMLKYCVSTTTANITLIDKETGIQYFSQTMKDVGIDFKEDNKKIQGGIGNPTLFSWGENRQITVSLSDAVTRMDWTAAKLGQQIKKGEVAVFKEAKDYIVQGGFITLDAAPIDPKALKIFNKETGALIDASKITVSEDNKKFTFGSGTIEDGKKVYVWGHNIESTGISIDIDANKFAKSFEVIVSAPVVIIQDGVPSTKFVKQYRFPMGRLDGNFKDDLKSKSDGGKFDSKIEIMNPNNGQSMGQIIIFPIDSLDKKDLASMGLAGQGSQPKVAPKE